MLIRRAEIEGHVLDVRLEHGRIAAIDSKLEPLRTEAVLDANGGALLPGLHDHHIHLFALAAAEQSLACGPPHVRSAAELANVLRAAAASITPASRDEAATAMPSRAIEPGSRWLRGVGYHESVAGDLDRHVLDVWVPDRPLRIQHRSGIAWFLNSAAVGALQLDEDAERIARDIVHGGVRAEDPHIERDETGCATGRLFRCDAWLRAALGEAPLPSLAGVSARLASFGVTGVTDATATNGASEMQAFVEATDRGDVLQLLHLMGGDDLPDSNHAEIRRAARKILLDEASLPSLDDLVSTIRTSHAADRAVAIHCVTRTEIVLACTALKAAGPMPADRLEHAAVAPPDIVELLADIGTTVATQPNFIFERGDEYLTDVEVPDRAWLYRCAGLLKAGIPVGAGTDAPYGDPNPWLAMQAAVSRLTRAGRTLGLEERVTPERALELFTSAAETPGGKGRTVAVGRPADLCLLDRGWRHARERLSSSDVRATFRSGRCVWHRE